MTVADALLADGAIVTVRSLRPDDRGELLALYDRCSSDALRMRFFSYARQLAEQDIDRMLRPGEGQSHSSLVAVLQGVMLGVGTIERTSPVSAEFALLVDDQHHGLGVGTLLLEHLVSTARRLGIETLSADILMENRAMLGVLRGLGARVKQSVEAGVVTVDFPTAIGDRWLAAVLDRETRAERASISRLLTPRSVAIVGASANRHNLGRRIVENLHAAGYTGHLSVVNRSGRGVAGTPGFQRLLDVDPPPELAVLAVPAGEVVPVATEAAAAGVAGIVVISSGFAEAGDEAGLERQRELLRLARDAGVRVIGPNSLGIINTASGAGLNATPAEFPVLPGPVGLISQSGGVGVALLAHFAAHGLGVSSAVSAGNKIDVSGNDLLMYWQDDPDTEICAMYVESFGNPRKFAKVARAFGRQKPILVVTGGRASATARAGDAGALAAVAPDAELDALFRECGVIRAHGLGELTDTLLLLSRAPRPAGDRIGVIANRRGPAAVAADAVIGAGLTMPELSERLSHRLTRAKVVGASPSSPQLAVQMTGPDRIAHAAEQLLGSDEVDGVVVCCAGLTGTDAQQLQEHLAPLGAASGRPVALVLLGSSASDASPAARLPVFDLPERAASAFAAAAAYEQWRRRASEPAEPPPDGIDVGAARRIVTRFADQHPAGGSMDSLDRSALLAAFGIGAESPNLLPRRPNHRGVEIQVEVINDGPVGPVVAVRPFGRRAGAGSNRFVHLAPMRREDATDTARCLVGDGVAAGTDPEADNAVEAAISDLLLRIGQLADAIPEVARLRLDPARIQAGGDISAEVEITLTTQPSSDVYLRQLAPIN